MELNEKEVASTFECIAKGDEGPDTRADLELYLLDELVANGTDAVGAEQHPWHEWFYNLWMSSQNLSDKSEIEKLSDAERTTYYIALLEAQVMNRGLGQYLANKYCE